MDETTGIQTAKFDLIVETSKLLDVIQAISPKKISRKKINEWLHYHIRQTGKTYDVKGMLIGYKGQPGGSGSQHIWNLDATNASIEIKELLGELNARAKALVTAQSQQVSNHNQGQNAKLDWNGLFFRSEAEIRIAKALDLKGIMFFPNSRCRLTNRKGHKDVIEVDFLVFFQGKVGILEVDGKEYHLSAASDHKRDRLFQRQGLLVSRFTGEECLNHPDLVVDEFCELLISSRT